MKDKNKLILGITSLIIFLLAATIFVMSMRKSEENNGNKTNTEDTKPFDLATAGVKDEGMSNNFAEKKNFIFKSQNELSDLIKKMYPEASKLPSEFKPDFEKNMVVAVFAGEKTTGGHSTQISDISESNDKIIITILETSPAEDCITTSVISSPYHIISLPKSDKEIVFETKTKTNSCN